MSENKILSAAIGLADRKASQSPLPKIGAAPWDRSLLQGRECGTCACYFEQPNPENALQAQGFCRRLPADMQAVRGLEPRVDLQGNPVMKDGKQVMQPAQIIGYMFKPTKADGTCFDGYRPLGTLPGERAIDSHIRLAADRLKPVLAKIPTEFRDIIAAVLGINTEPQN